MVKNVWTKDERMARPEEALDFILCEHFRHREMCNALDRLADSSTASVKEATALAEFIRSDLTMHILDEEELLFPLLRRRCLPEDAIDAALERLDREHEEDRDLSAEVRVILLTAATESKAPCEIPGGAEALRKFAHSQRRHMMLENAVLIPLARRRLTREDLDTLGKKLAARHQSVALASSG